MFKKVLIANRGAIACRVIRTLDRMGLASVAVYSEADRYSLHVRKAGEAILVGPPPAAKSYLDQGAILDAALRTGAEAIHPGYGFLSENAEFAEACEARGIRFIGPAPEVLEVFGDKARARELAERCGVPLAAGSNRATRLEDARAFLADGPIMLPYMSRAIRTIQVQQASGISTSSVAVTRRSWATASSTSVRGATGIKAPRTSRSIVTTAP